MGNLKYEKEQSSMKIDHLESNRHCEFVCKIKDTNSIKNWVSVIELVMYII